MTDVRRRAAGWYDDEADAAVLRYWDGAKWTPHTTPRPAEEPAQAVRAEQTAAPAAVAAVEVAAVAEVAAASAPAAAPADESTAMRPMPPAAPAAPGQPEPPRPPQAQTPVPAPVAATPGLTMTSSSPEFVSDTLRAPSFSPPPVLHAPNEHTTAPLPPNDDRAAASARSVATAEPGERTFLLTWLFALLLGSLGADRFYLGKIGTAVAKLLTAGGFGVWTLVDLVLVLTGAQRDREGRTLSGYDEHRRLAWIVSGAVVGLGVLAAIGVSVAVASLSASLGAVGGLG